MTHFIFICIHFQSYLCPETTARYKEAFYTIDSSREHALHASKIHLVLKELGQTATEVELRRLANDMADSHCEITIAQFLYWMGTRDNERNEK